MTTGPTENEDLFVADFYPQLGEYLAEQHATGYDGVAARTRFLIWLGTHADAEASAAADPVQDYLVQIGKVAPLSPEQEVTLARRIEAGRGAEEKLAAAAGLTPDQRLDLERIAQEGSRAKNDLLEANLRMVVSLAERNTGRGMSFLDLVQEGNLGLVRAVEKFDHTKGHRFSTYATWWVRQAMVRAMADPARAPRISVHMAEGISEQTRRRRQERDSEGQDQDQGTSLPDVPLARSVAWDLEAPGH